MSSLSPIGSTANTSQTQSTAANLKKVQNDFQTLAASLQSGNLANAQQAYGALQSDAPGLFDSSQGDSSTSAATTALNDLGTALQSGDLSGAQQAFSALQQSVQSPQSQGQSVEGHHHGHHHGGGSDAAAATQDSSTSTGINAITGGSSSIGGGFSAIA